MCAICYLLRPSTMKRRTLALSPSTELQSTPGAAGTRRNGGRPSTDPDAAWRGRGASAWKRPTFGYNLTVAVTAPEVGGSSVPLAAKSMRLRKITSPGIDAALSVVNSVAKSQGSLSDVLADREYTMSNNGADFLLPVRALGGEPVFQLTEHQLGAHGTSHGAIIIDGQPFSPSTPRRAFGRLRSPRWTPQPRRFASIKTRSPSAPSTRWFPTPLAKPTAPRSFSAPPLLARFSALL
jgi:hypothetical protein